MKSTPRKRTIKKKRKLTPPCPECGSSTILPIIHGVPTAVQTKAIRQGKAILADREEWEGMSEWYCKTCGSDWSRHSRRFKKPGGVNATRSDQ
jgi:hypothetical protein